MNSKRNGFTLVELLVVVIILGILATISVPQYLKTVEVSKASDAAAMVATIGNANRMYNMDRPGAPVNGQILTSCNTASCTVGATTSACQLVACKYLAPSPWGTATTGLPYNYYVCNGATGGACCVAGSVACAKRKDGHGDYTTWGYTIDSSGACATLAAGVNNPACPGLENASVAP
ncbi:MAG TPA: prepilin-type N-terminal cleavage/methylation domain-containing protein [Elusimicrobiales bacterium]|nr:prepilin-type N-terminal cleavage/methylation domain-containing protein [Elusimicrobiales bacterium]